MDEAWGNVSSGRTSNVVPALRSLTERPRTPSRRFSTSCTRARRCDQSTSSFSPARAATAGHERTSTIAATTLRRAVTAFSIPCRTSRDGEGECAPSCAETGEKLGHGQAQVGAHHVAEDGEQQADGSHGRMIDGGDEGGGRVAADAGLAGRAQEEQGSAQEPHGREQYGRVDDD